MADAPIMSSILGQSKAAMAMHNKTAIDCFMASLLRCLAMKSITAIVP